MKYSVHVVEFGHHLLLIGLISQSVSCTVQQKMQCDVANVHRWAGQKDSMIAALKSAPKT